MILLTSSAMLLLTGAALIIYEFFAYKQNLLEHVRTIAQIAAEHSTGPLAFPDEKVAFQTLSSLRLEIREASLYDRKGSLFTRYPPNSRVPLAVPRHGSRIEGNNIIVVLPVIEKGQVLGTIYVRSDLTPVYGRISFYAGVVMLILLGSFVVTLGLSTLFQKRISQPILALAEVAHVVSAKKDYSVRV